MDRIEVLVSHQDRLTVRIGSTFVKIDAAGWRLTREVEAMALVPVPTPDVLWHHDNALGLREVRGTQLGQLGVPSTAPGTVWRQAGAVARRIHSLPTPPWPGWDADGFANFVDGELGWLVDNALLSSASAVAARAAAEPALRPFPAVFTHGDFQPAHVLYDDDEITGVIDWADACTGDALFDLAVLTVDNKERIDEVLEGYGDDVDREVLAAWWVVRHIGAARWMIQHGFGADRDLAALASGLEPHARPAIRGPAHADQL